MTITAEQLDELEQCAQPVEGFPDAVRAVAIPGDVTLQLVAVYRAALLVDTAIPDTLHEVQAHRMLREAIRGETVTDYDDGYERAEAMEMAQDRADEERSALSSRIADLELRLSIATESNVNDRKRIAELEALNAAAARAVDVMDDIGEQARARIGALETALTEAINWIADRSSPDSVLVGRLRKLLPSEET